MAKPKILFVNPTRLLKRPISHIMENLSKKRYKTSLLIPGNFFGKRDSSLHHSNKIKDSQIITYASFNPPFLGSEQPLPPNPFWGFKVINEIKKHDIIHMWVPYYLTNLKIIYFLKWFFPKKKFILTMDTLPGLSFSMGKIDFFFKLYNKLFGKLIFRRANTITLYGKSLIPFALKAGVPKNKIKIIPTGIDIPDKIEKNDDLRKELKLDKKTKIVLFAGLIVPRKGIETIIYLAEKLRKEDIVFALAGDSKKRKEYEKTVREKELENKVFFLGWRKDMHKLYQGSDLFFLPSKGEGLPGVIMEAMSYGLPCVSSNIPCIPDLIEDNKNGMLFELDNPKEAEIKIKKLLKKKEEFGKKAKEKMKTFKWEKIIKLYEELYEK
jgi:glycosyltransferase involved in cell wall biosynthesis